MSDSGNNYGVFRECVSGAIVQKSQGGRKKRKLKGKKRGDTTAKDSKDEDGSFGIEKQDPEELADFIDACLLPVTVYLPKLTNEIVHCL